MAKDSGETRHETVLEAAVGVFARYGFRKTSMDEVARAAGVSRQGLYLQFADKEELFKKAVEYKLNRQLSAAILALSNAELRLENRLVAACDEWAGRFVGLMGSDSEDLLCARTTLAGATLNHYEGQFELALSRAIAASPLGEHSERLGFTPVEVARALHAATRGLKQSCQSRQEFVQGITVTARLFCASPNPKIPAPGADHAA